jgi:FlaA1/EpsC-like NDP-sugar epimerase
MLMNTSSFFGGKRIAVTGAAGTVGQELVKQLLGYQTREVRAIDNNESALFFLAEEYSTDPRLQAFLTDVRDPKKLNRMFNSIDLVFHAAALKHVPLCERSPFDAVQTNIMGVQNVIQAAISNRVQKVLFTSSDKAVNPTNVMGTSKLMGERLMTAANALQQQGEGTIFASTRFGNVAGSRGSVIPLFCQQIAAGGPVTLTDAAMTRFVMPLEHAVRLVITSMSLACGGEVFITKMPVLQVKDLANVMISLLPPVYGKKAKDIKIQEIGPRPGEKFYEELMNGEETRRALDSEDLFIILPAFRNIYADIDYTYEGITVRPVQKTYNSENEEFMSPEDIERFLMLPDVLPNGTRGALLSERETA